VTIWPGKYKRKILPIVKTFSHEQNICTERGGDWQSNQKKFGGIKQYMLLWYCCPVLCCKHGYICFIASRYSWCFILFRNVSYISLVCGMCINIKWNWTMQNAIYTCLPSRFALNFLFCIKNVTKMLFNHKLIHFECKYMCNCFGITTETCCEMQ